MDIREALRPDTRLAFPGMVCCVENAIGKGSNAIVYKAWYADAYGKGLRHHILLKELFPYDPDGGITRAEDGSIRVEEGSRELYQLHKLSFESANSIHLKVLEAQPDGVGANLNTYTLNGTLYTLLGYDGGRTLEEERPNGLAQVIALLSGILGAVDVFHSSGYLHLDISPDNIVLTGHGETCRVSLIDFNSVHSLDDLREGRDPYCSVKKGFTAPEVRRRSSQVITPAADLYSVGGVLYWALTGEILTGDVKTTVCDDMAMLSDAPESVKAMIRHILLKTLFPLAGKRYQSVGEMLEDVRELKKRSEGVGITHCALWEAGKRSTEHMLRQNPAYSYIRDKEKLYPCRTRMPDGKTWTEDELLQNEHSHFLLRGEGGIGKTTFLLRLIHEQPNRYTPSSCATFYIPLYGYRDENGQYIRNRLLETLKFGEETKNIEEARHQLELLLDKPVHTRGEDTPSVRLLLDGLNEAGGETQSLLDEIRLLMGKAGAQLIISTRTLPEGLELPAAELLPLEEDIVSAALAKEHLLPPEDETLRRSLTTPLILSAYIATALAKGEQILTQDLHTLLANYLDSLREKEKQRYAENEEGRWQCDAAVRYVLPMLALAMREGPLTDGKMLAVVSSCWKTIRSKWMIRVFPEWIGHSLDIVQGSDRAEDWYGRVILEILWRRMGILVKNADGRWSVFHQVLREELEEQGKQLKKLVFRRRGAAWVIAGAAAAVILALCMAQYSWLTRPYDDKKVEKAIDYASAPLGGVYELAKYSESFLNDDGISLEELENFKSFLTKKQEEFSDERLPASRLDSVLEKALETGTRVSWSGEPLDREKILGLKELWGDMIFFLTEWADQAIGYMNDTGKPLSDETIENMKEKVATYFIQACEDFESLLPHVKDMDSWQYLIRIFASEDWRDAANSSQIDPARGWALMQECLAEYDRDDTK